MRTARPLMLTKVSGAGPRAAAPPEQRWTLHAPDGVLPTGWCALRGLLLRRGGDYDARLYVDGGDGADPGRPLPISASLKGTVNELVWLPPGTRRLELALHGDPGDFELGSWSLGSVGPVQRGWRLLHRIVPQLWRQPRAKRRQLGLTLPNTLTDPTRTYERASMLRAHAPAPTYAEWISRFDRLQPMDRKRIGRQIASWRRPPLFHILLAGEDADRLRATGASLDAQLFRGFECMHVRDESALAAFNARLAAASPSDWTLLLRAGDELAPHALYWLACVAQARPEANVIYADEDALDAAGQRCKPHFKPDWSWAHARASRFVGDSVVLKSTVLARAGGISASDCRHGSHDAVLRVLDQHQDRVASEVVPHVPAVLLHRPPGQEHGPEADAWAMGAVRAHLARRGVAAQVEPTHPGCWRVRHTLPHDPPLVSIIVATRDALPLLRRCIDSLREHTTYPRYEIVLVDNQSVDPDAIAWMRRQSEAGTLRLLSYDRPFNYSAINNLAVREARGELVCLLNNDTEIIQGDWLEEMVSQLLQPGVEVVGAKLLYANGRVQHGGDLVGVGGVANHAHAWLRRDAPGYRARALVAQEYSAVTGACLLTRSERYLALGGLDERHLPVAFNDVDYCLRVRDAGGHVVWTPHAQLLHHESVSRGKDITPAQRRRARREAAYMRRRWRHVLGQDPFYNPNLNQERPDFSLGHAPVIRKPWLE